MRDVKQFLFDMFIVLWILGILWLFGFSIQEMLNNTLYSPCM